MLGLITVEPGEMGGISCSILGQLGEPKNLRRIPRRDRTKADSGGFGGNRWVTAGHKRAAADVGETLHSSGDDAEARNWSQYVANLRGPVTLFSTLSGGFGAIRPGGWVSEFRWSSSARPSDRDRRPESCGPLGHEIRPLLEIAGLVSQVPCPRRRDSSGRPQIS